jgi:NADPH2:quinone reductase
VNAFGSHAELRSVPARNAWVVPDGFDIRQASAIPVPFGTADDCLFEFGRLKAGETVLVQAGAGAVGLAAIQLAKRAGARVFATASSDEKLAKLKPFGMDHGINYAKQDVVAEVMKLTDNKGVDLVVDPVGGSTLEKSILSTGARGRVSMVGNAGREDSRVDVRPLMAANRSLTGVFLGAEIMTDRVHDMIQRHIDDAAAGKLKVVIDKTFALKDAAAAHTYIEGRGAVGRVLLIP